MQRKATFHLYTFLVSKTLSTLGANVYAFGMSLFILAMTGSALSFAANLIFSIIPRTLLSPVAGLLVDRVSKKFIVLSGQLGTILSISCLLIYMTFFDISLPAIYLTTFFYTISSTFTTIAFSASIGNLVDAERIQKAMSFNQLSLSIAGILGPMIGGMLFGFVSIETFLIINIVAYSLALLLESTMNFKLFSSTESSPKESMVQSLKSGIHYIKEMPMIKNLMYLLLWINLFFTSITVGANFIFVNIIKMEYQLIGIVEAASAIGMLVVSIYFAVRSNIKYPLLFSKRAVLALSTLVGTFALPLLIPMTSTIVFIYYLTVMFLFGGSLVLTNTPIGIMIQKDVEENFRGRIYGIIEMFAMGLTPIGTLLFGLLYDVIPAQFILLFCSMALILTTLFLMPRRLIETAYPDLSGPKAKTINPTSPPFR
ncbi:transmembrane secretion effector [Ureibacillus xyleni]|uniref:Transmembrane secretion effector n=1 Tax=Ureibacillus xyleni TaxID=614648 RepID=A0A285SJZ2_9BACL|nr:MFS transporter [Ureibacillus xyleni]SOC06288.1 transmembrane secretion effector [Ureibacillus xyleni]